MKHVTKNSLELAPGDIVLAHGMRVLLRHEGTKQTYNRPTADGYRTVVSWTGEVLNLDEVLAAGTVPPSFIREGFWVIQGNELAQWYIETPGQDGTACPHCGGVNGYHACDEAERAAPANPALDNRAETAAKREGTVVFLGSTGEVFEHPGPGLSPVRWDGVTGSWYDVEYRTLGGGNPHTLDGFYPTSKVIRRVV
jgi:hypothetical protein